MKKLIIIRHGETDYSIKQKCCGQTDVPINSKGIKQAEVLHDSLKRFKVDKVYTSNMKRTIQTAKIIFRDKPLNKRRGIREIDFGKFTGLTYKDIKMRYYSAFKVFMDDPANAKMLKGDTIRGFAQRVIRSYNRIYNENPNKTVAIVAHINPIRVILLHILGKTINDYWSIHQDIGAINVIEFKNKKPKIIAINDTSYLK